MRYSSAMFFRHQAFTLLELLLAIGVIATIAGLSLAGWRVAMEQGRQGRSRTMVAAVAAAIASYPEGVAPTRPVRLLWDFNRDGLVDGQPEADAGFSAADRAAAAAVGYRGLLAMTAMAVPPGLADVSGRPLDAWKRPLHIAFATEIYGASGFGVWSAGHDGLDNTADDLTSWGR